MPAAARSPTPWPTRASEILHPRAGRLPRPGDGQLGPRPGVHRREVHLQGHLVRRRRQAVPTPGPLLRRRCHEAVRRRPLPAAAPGLRRAAPRRRPLARLAGRPTTTSSPGTRRPSSSTRSTATAARTRRRDLDPSRTHGRRCRTSRGSSTWPTSWPRPATTRSTRRAGSCSTRRTGPGARASAAPGVTATPASSTPRPTPRRSPCDRCSTGRTSRCWSAPRSTKLTTDSVGPHGHRRRRAPQRRSRRRTAGDIVVVSAGAANSAKLLLRSANDAAPERAGQRLGPGRAQLHVPQLQGRRRTGQGAQRHRVPEDARPSTTSTSAPPTTTGPLGNIQMIGKSNAEAMKGEEPKLTKLAPHFSPGRGRPARRRLLADDRGPAAAREPGHRRRRRQRPPRLHVDQRRGGRPASTTS